LLEVDGVSIGFPSPDGLTMAVDNVSFTLHKGEAIAIVGESGSGKSLTLRAILGLLERSGAKVSQGSIRFRGRDLLNLGGQELRALRGEEIAVVSQDVSNSLHPLYTVGWQISEAIRIHHPDVSKKEAHRRAVDLLGQVGIPSPARRADDYPLSFSGGMRQRAAIAMAMANRPRLMLADEPTTAVDATIQAQLLALIRELQEAAGMALVMVTHDLAVVSDIATSVGILYAGHMVEWGKVDEVFAKPAHPYTEGLLRARPAGRRGERLLPIPGAPPYPGTWPTGCVFHPRCARAAEVCGAQRPELREVAPGRLSACHVSDELMGAHHGV
jgi:oligopeptide/dipeptide ABC transporter ATP-binding protein